jgi:NADPH-dependent 2,4-dienoyl-CoA reductase/sulfur reductase-like enzyme/peroxiredoxin family protein/rhodanese-related sulfurtransferase/TusA-related sulfurtransferase
MSSTRIVIVGGVAGGATAAARARRIAEDAKITVFERGPYVSFANCGLPYHVGGEIKDRAKLLLQTPEALKARYNIDVRVRSEVRAIDRAGKEVEVACLETRATYRVPYDKLILSPGAAPIRPPLPGIEHPKIFTLRSVPDVDRIKAVVDAGAKSALVVGGGFIGLEMVENLHRRGLTVHLVELLDQVMPPLDKEMTTPVHQVLLRNGVDVRLADAVTAFADESGKIAATLKSGATLSVDLVILAVGVRPENGLAKAAGLELTERGAIRVNAHMQTADPDIYAIGDAASVTDAVTGQETLIPLAGPANRQGRIAADHALGRPARFRGAQGTAVVRVFDLTVASTGASEKTLRRLTKPFEKIYVHPAHHVGYFPGAQPMSIKLVFDPADGRVLGGQIVGGEGVDKRIDVLAVAIQAEMTVYDLEEVELAYAPQYGSAKDPVNMAGFVAANLLRGEAQIVHADNLAGATLLDVRGPEEFAAGAVPGAKLIPLPELRARLGELPKDVPIVAYCAVGMRGYVAARLLAQHGFSVRNLSGGYRTWTMFNPPAGKPAGMAPPSTPTESAPPKSPSCTSGTKSATSCPADRELDVTGQCCPGPIVAVADSLKTLAAGQVLRVVASDIGFLTDIPAWCASTGNELLDAHRVNGHVEALIRKPASAAAPAARSADAKPEPARPNGKTIVVFSSDLDRVLAALVIANGALALGQQVALFFTFWGLSALRRPVAPLTRKTALERMFGWMIPRSASRLTLSKMHMAGAGTAMMKHVMKTKNVADVTTMLVQARDRGARLIACTMSMDVMGLKSEELIEGVELGGVAAYLAAVDNSNASLFI